MNEEFILCFINQRMKQMNVEAFTIEPLFITAIKTGERFTIQNEWWYLVGLPTDVKIVSDTAYYNSFGLDLDVMNAPEFTGTINIKAVAENVPLHFIRVIIQK